MQPAALQGSYLSLQQQHLWSLQSEKQVYSTVCAVMLEGALSIAALHRALHSMVEQHEILRTVFYCPPGIDVPMQIIAGNVDQACPESSLEELSPTQQLAQLEAAFKDAQTNPFDLAQGPLLRASLLKLSVHRHLLLLSLPALCADAPTLWHFVSELSQFYTLCLRNEELPAPSLQYADISAWQKQLLEEEDATLPSEYWHKVDLSSLSICHLPFERRALPAEQIENASQKASLPSQVLAVPVKALLYTQIEALTHCYGISLQAFWLSCWQVLLWRLTTEPARVIGVACEGRGYEELTNALGLHTRFVPISSDFADDLPFEQLLRQTNSLLEEASEKQAYFTWQEHTSQAGRKQEPFYYPISFEYVSGSVKFPTPKLDFSIDKLYSCMEPCALKLNILYNGETVHVELYYDQLYLLDDDAQRLRSCLLTLLHSVVKQPHLLAGKLEILDSGERQRLLEMFTDTVADYPRHLLIQQLFEIQAERTPSQVAVICRDEQLTYAQLNTQANQLAHYLRRRGIGPNVLVGLCMERSTAMIVALLGILKAGGAYVPLEPDNPPARLIYQLGDARILLVLTQEKFATQLSAYHGAVLRIERYATLLEQEKQTNLEALAGPDDLAYAIYTSGSTGGPKGVAIRQQSLVNYTHFMQAKIACEKPLHIATVSTLSADLGNTSIYCALVSGSTLHVLPYETVISGESFLEYIRTHPIDVLKIVPSHLGALLEALPQDQRSEILPRKHLLLGGEALPGILLTQIAALEGHCAVINHYGPTETTIGIVINELGVLKQNNAQEYGLAASVPIGRPIANAEAYILDRYLQIVPVGVTGELYLGGVGLAKEYLYQPKQTRERFIAHPFHKQDGARVYKTGDLARVTTDGMIEFMGRVDTQVKLRGYRVEPGEIEMVLQQHPSVQRCAVVLKDGSEGQYLIAYIVPKQQASYRETELRHFLQERLPAYMLPASIVLLQELPLNRNGKVDRQLLTRNEKSEQLLKIINQEKSSGAFVDPRDIVEYQLLSIWEEILSARPISVTDNFFEIGGNSLVAVRLMSLIKKQFGRDLPLATLFQQSTLSGLATELRQQVVSEQRSALVALQPQGALRPFFCIHPVGGTVFRYRHLAHYLGSDQPFYGLQAPELDESEQHDRTINEIVAHYITIIQTLQPKGPYCLGGWSLGGVIAFEMARQLVKQGDSVALLALLDTSVPYSFYSPKTAEPLEIDDDNIVLAQWLIDRDFITRPGEDYYALEPKEQIKYVWEKAKANNVIPAGTDFEQFLRISHVTLRNVYALRNYVPQVYPQRITLFRASESVQEVGAPGYEGDPQDAYTRARFSLTGGWEQLTEDEVDVHIVPGGHSNLVDEPNVQVLAALLKSCLAKTQQLP